MLLRAFEYEFHQEEGNPLEDLAEERLCEMKNTF